MLKGSAEAQLLCTQAQLPCLGAAEHQASPKTIWNCHNHHQVWCNPATREKAKQTNHTEERWQVGTINSMCCCPWTREWMEQSPVHVKEVQISKLRLAAGFVASSEARAERPHANQGCANTETKGPRFLPSFILSIQNSSSQGFSVLQWQWINLNSWYFNSFTAIRGAPGTKTPTFTRRWFLEKPFAGPLVQSIRVQKGNIHLLIMCD